MTYKIDIDFSGLEESLRKMGAEPANVGSLTDKTLEPISEILKDLDTTGYAEIDLKDVSNVGGILAVGNQPVSLHILEPYITELGIKKNIALGPRFHIAECQTLERMRNENRFERYIVSIKTTGQFSLKLQDSEGVRLDEQKDYRLLPCQNCLKTLNYKGFWSLSSSRKLSLVNNFSLKEFFVDNKPTFRTLPKYTADNHPGEDYTRNWSEISRRFREKKSWCCECCQANFSEHHGLLHTHHINRNKRDNRKSNLRAFCVLCHQKQPDHNKMHIKSDEKKLVKTIRKQQNIDHICKSCGS